MKIKFFIFLTVLIFNPQIRGQEAHWNKTRLLTGGNVSLQRGETNLDNLFIGFKTPLPNKFLTGLSYGYFSTDTFDKHCIALTLGYNLVNPGSGHLYLNTDISFFYRQYKSKPLNPFDDKFFRHTFGFGYLLPIYKRLSLDFQAGLFGFFYRRDDPHASISRLLEPGEIKAGIGYGF